MFNIGVYLRKAYPDSWESEILNYNMQYLEPPLPLNEVNIVAKQLETNNIDESIKYSNQKASEIVQQRGVSVITK